MKVLAINPGGTSTKVAVYDGRNLMFKNHRPFCRGFKRVSERIRRVRLSTEPDFGYTGSKRWVFIRPVRLSVCPMVAWVWLLKAIQPICCIRS